MTTEYNVVLDEGAFMPTRTHESDAGADLYSPIDFVIYPGQIKKIDTGVHMEIPMGCAGFVKSKSGLVAKHGIVTIEDTIDAGYTGSIGVMLYNIGERPYEIRRGDKISQIVIQPVVLCGFRVVENLVETERGDGGFGSTGV